jgi:hypothetical protein
MGKRKPMLPAMWSTLDPNADLVTDAEYVAELRAAEAVIRAARKVAAENIACEHFVEYLDPLEHALARLSRVTGRGER